jgi:hypothetical protein
MYHQNTVKLLPSDAIWHPKRPKSSITPLWEPQNSTCSSCWMTCFEAHLCKELWDWILEKGCTLDWRHQQCNVCLLPTPFISCISCLMILTFEPVVNNIFIYTPKQANRSYLPCHQCLWNWNLIFTKYPAALHCPANEYRSHEVSFVCADTWMTMLLWMQSAPSCVRCVQICSG